MERRWDGLVVGFVAVLVGIAAFFFFFFGMGRLRPFRQSAKDAASASPTWTNSLTTLVPEILGASFDDVPGTYPCDEVFGNLTNAFQRYSLVTREDAKIAAKRTSRPIIVGGNLSSDANHTIRIATDFNGGGTSYVRDGLPLANVDFGSGVQTTNFPEWFHDWGHVEDLALAIKESESIIVRTQQEGDTFNFGGVVDGRIALVVFLGTANVVLTDDDVALSILAPFAKVQLKGVGLVDGFVVALAYDDDNNNAAHTQLNGRGYDQEYTCASSLSPTINTSVPSISPTPPGSEPTTSMMPTPLSIAPADEPSLRPSRRPPRSEEESNFPSSWSPSPPLSMMSPPFDPTSFPSPKPSTPSVSPTHHSTFDFGPTLAASKYSPSVPLARPSFHHHHHPTRDTSSLKGPSRVPTASPTTSGSSLAPTPSHSNSQPPELLLLLLTPTTNSGRSLYPTRVRAAAGPSTAAPTASVSSPAAVISPTGSSSLSTPTALPSTRPSLDPSCTPSSAKQSNQPQKRIFSPTRRLAIARPSGSPANTTPTILPTSTPCLSDLNGGASSPAPTAAQTASRTSTLAPDVTGAPGSMPAALQTSSPSSGAPAIAQSRTPSAAHPASPTSSGAGIVITPSSLSPTIDDVSASRPTSDATSAPSTAPRVAPTTLPTLASTPTLSSDLPASSPSISPAGNWPTANPLSSPANIPTACPTTILASYPTTAQLLAGPSAAPTTSPSSGGQRTGLNETSSSLPSSLPAALPSTSPSRSPPTAGPRHAPTASPTSASSPTVSPNLRTLSTTPTSSGPTNVTPAEPRAAPTASRTSAPSPTVGSSDSPVGATTALPTPSTSAPSAKSSTEPWATSAPSSAPTVHPSVTRTSTPTALPTNTPSSLPTSGQSPAPSAAPTASPTSAPSTAPTTTPSGSPTSTPTALPTSTPWSGPTSVPSAGSSAAPTLAPSPAPTASPSDSPTSTPTALPTITPSLGPTSSPTAEPSAAPSASPTLVPSPAPTASPSDVPTRTPTSLPTSTPSTSPTRVPSAGPSAAPTAMPTTASSPAPTARPSGPPTSTPTALPTSTPSSGPTNVPSAGPSSTPTESPTLAPSPAPTASPSDSPTSTPTALPTSIPSFGPTHSPSAEPSAAPSASPTLVPSPAPTASPSDVPTRTPTSLPTSTPSSSPTRVPSSGPSAVPTAMPTSSPSPAPTASPSGSPTSTPTALPTNTPSSGPTSVPSAGPSALPTESPSLAPSPAPTASPSDSPTSTPTALPTSIPSFGPTHSPSAEPSAAPSASPTLVPSPAPSVGPTTSPISAPTELPTSTPSSGPTSAPSSGLSRAPTVTPSPSSDPTSAEPSTAPSMLPTSLPTTFCLKVDGMAAYFPFEDGLAVDYTDNSQNCVVQGATTTTDRLGDTSGALFFNGSSNVLCDSTAVGGAKPRTYCAWARADNSADSSFYALFHTGDAGGEVNCTRFELRFNFGNGRLYWIGGGPSSCNVIFKSSSETVPDPNNWHFLCIGYDGVDVTIHADGALLVTYTPLLRVVTGPEQELVVGHVDEVPSDDFLGWVGAIDDVMVFDEALSTIEVDDLYKLTVEDRLSVRLANCPPTPAPSSGPTPIPTVSPSSSPTSMPLMLPTNIPSLSPTRVPSEGPSAVPTKSPTLAPSPAPTASPSDSPTSTPTALPTSIPSFGPTHSPSAEPSAAPSASPTLVPSPAPSVGPTTSPISAPTELPTSTPSSGPTSAPSSGLSRAPTVTPSPSSDPTSAEPSTAPSMLPTSLPTTFCLKVDGMAAYFPFEDGLAVDYTDNSQNCVVQGATTTPDRLGDTSGALFFNGSSNVLCDSTAVGGAKPRTYCAWARADNSADSSFYALFHTGDAGGEVNCTRFELRFNFGNGRLYWIGGGPSSCNVIFKSSSETVPDPNNWHFLCITYDGVDVTIHADGALLVTYTPLLRVVTGPERELVVGHVDEVPSDDFLGWVGAIDDVMVFDEALSTTEVDDLYKLTIEDRLSVRLANCPPTPAPSSGPTPVPTVSSSRSGVSTPTPTMSTSPLSKPTQTPSANLTSTLTVSPISMPSSASTAPAGPSKVPTAVPSFLPTTFCLELSGMAAYFPFEDGLAVDYTGNNQNCVVQGATTTPDRLGDTSGALFFNGSTNVLCDGTAVGGAKPRTYCAWARADDSADSSFYALFHTGDAGGGVNCTRFELRFNFGNGRLYWIGGGPSSCNVIFKSSSETVSDPKDWHFLCIGYDGVDMTIHADGALLVTYMPLLPVVTGPEQELVVGHVDEVPSDDFLGWVGAIDDVVVFDRALSTTEVNDLYKLTVEDRLSVRLANCPPTLAPSSGPMLVPTVSGSPTSMPSAKHTTSPTFDPTVVPLAEPSAAPTVLPTSVPTTFCLKVDGMTAYFPFEDGLAVDYTGNNQNCVVQGATTTPDRLGDTSGALFFNGSSNVLCDGTAVGGAKPRTYCAWARADDSADSSFHALFHTGDAGGGVNCTRFELRFNSGNGRLYWIGGGPSSCNVIFKSSSETVSDPKDWHFLCIGYDGVDVTIHADGALLVTYTPLLQVVTGPEQELVVGHVDEVPSDDFLGWVGAIDDVVVFDRALSTTEVDDLYKLTVEDRLSVRLANCPPTAAPSSGPTLVPTVYSSGSLTSVPSAKHTTSPTSDPTVVPLAEPSAAPTVLPTSLPTTFCLKVDGMTAYFPFEDGLAVDYTGNNQNCVVQGATTTTDRLGDTSGALFFNGSSNVLCDGTAVDGETPRTYCAWARADNSADSSFHALFHTGDAGGEVNCTRFELRFNSGNGRLYWIGGGPSSCNVIFKSSSETVPDPNDWHFLCIGYDGVHVTIHADGALLVTYTPLLQVVTGPEQELVVGHVDEVPSDDFLGWVGAIDDVVVFDRALSTTEVDDLYKLTVEDRLSVRLANCPPTAAPSSGPTLVPTVSGSPRSMPTALPTVTPSSNPSFAPSAGPSTGPSAEPSFLPTTLCLELSGLVAYFPFEDGLAVEYTGNSQNCVVQGATITTDRLDDTSGALFFNGSSNVLCDGTAVDEVDPRTYCAWARADNSADSSFYALFHTGDAGGEVNCTRFELRFNSGNGRLYWIGGGPTSCNVIFKSSSETVPDPNDWHFLCIGYDGVDVTIHADGALLVTYTPLLPVVTGPGQELVVGHVDEVPSDDFLGWVGAIDDVMVFDEALSTTEVDDLYKLTVEDRLSARLANCLPTPAPALSSWGSPGSTPAALRTNGLSSNLTSARSDTRANISTRAPTELPT